MGWAPSILHLETRIASPGIQPQHVDRVALACQQIDTGRMQFDMAASKESSFTNGQLHYILVEPPGRSYWLALAFPQT